MINIRFPDGAVRQYENGISAFGIAQSISEGLARKSFSSRGKWTSVGLKPFY